MDRNAGLMIPRSPTQKQKHNKLEKQAAGEGCLRGWGKGAPVVVRLLGTLNPLALAQVMPLPSCLLTLPTLFRNRVPETGRAAGREARSVPVSFPFESPCGISFHTVRKSERETVGWSAAPGRLPHSWLETGSSQAQVRPAWGRGEGPRLQPKQVKSENSGELAPYQAPC